jgi:hypothetical protein
MRLAVAGFQTIEDLVAGVSLVDMRILEDSVRVLSRSTSDTEDETAEGAGNKPEMHFRVMVRTEPQTMRFRYRLSFTFESAEYVSDIESVYEVPEGESTVTETDRAIVQDFSERVAFMATYPHARAAVFAAAGRLGLTRPLLPLIRPSEVQRGDILTPEELGNEFGIEARTDQAD